MFSVQLFWVAAFVEKQRGECLLLLADCGPKFYSCMQGHLEDFRNQFCLCKQQQIVTSTRF